MNILTVADTSIPEALINGTRSLTEALAIGFFLVFIVVPILLGLSIANVIKLCEAARHYVIVKNYSPDNEKYVKIDAVITESDLRRTLNYTVDIFNYSFKTDYESDETSVLIEIKKPKRYIIFDPDYYRKKITVYAMIFVPSFLMLLGIIIYLITP